MATVDDAFLPWKTSAPLAARMRPRKLSEYVGQQHILGPGKLLRRAIEADQIGSILLWGPPGSGKTTLARVIAGATRSHFETLNAVLAGVKDIRAVVARARERLDAEPDLFEGPRRTTLFVDEVHRFNKAQQDALLPHVENGTVIFIGATTENPYFEVIKPLVSRSRLFQLQPLTRDDLQEIARAALADPERGYGSRDVRVDDEALEHLTDMAQGDARNLLNALELAVETTSPAGDGGDGGDGDGGDGDRAIIIDRDVAEESIQRRALLYDKDGDAHYDTISAFIKSLRGSDPDAALYWLAKMVRAGEDPKFIARRLVIFASEDVGMADPHAISVATAAARAVEFVGLPECQWNLSHAVLYLSTAPKSNSAIAYFEALRSLEEQGDDEVPDPLKDASRDKEGLGHGQGYKYPHAFREHWVAQQYLPDGLQGVEFYRPSEIGAEADVKERVDRLRELQTSGLAREKRIESVASGRERRRRAQIEAHGEAAIRLRDEVLRRAECAVDAAVLDVSARGGLVAWGALDLAPLGRIEALGADQAAAASIASAASGENVDRVLSARVGDIVALPLDDSSIDRVLGVGALSRTTELATAASEFARVLRPAGGGRIVLHEPLLSETRPLSSELDLRDLGDELASRLRAAEAAIYSDPEDPRMMFRPEAVVEALEAAGLREVEVERVRDAVKRKITPDLLVRWFSASGGSSGERETYEERLRRALSADELAAYRRLLESRLLGRTIVRPVVGVFIRASRG